MNLRRRAIWLVVGGLLLSILANVLLIRQIRALYAERLMAQIFPSRPPQPPMTDVNPGQFSSTILLFGDSRMSAWELPPLADARMVNAGVNGATTAQLRLQLPQLLDEFKPDVMVLQAGINDLKLVGLRPELEEALILQAATNRPLKNDFFGIFYSKNPMILRVIFQKHGYFNSLLICWPWPTIAGRVTSR